MSLLHWSRWFVVASFPLACAVATEPELRDDDEPPRAGTTSISGAGSAGTMSVGSTSATGGTTAKAGTSSGGTSSAAGKPNRGGASSAGSGGGGKGGAGTAGNGGSAGVGTAGSTGAGCGGLKTWKGGDPTLQIAQGEVIQWMGKRYKATTTIAYPNNECAPDKPTDWCASWFEPDGDC